MSKPKSKRKDHVAEVVETLIEKLKIGAAPWQRPWDKTSSALAYNPTSGKTYRGFNQLWLTMQYRGDPRWLTYAQAASSGAQVRKGETGTVIQYWVFNGKEDLLDENGNKVLDSRGKPIRKLVEYDRPRVMASVVFNAEQIDGLPALEIRPLRPEAERHDRAEKLMMGWPSKISFVGGNQAFYSPDSDTITLPARHQFHSSEVLYQTAFHEIGHSTGHESRLDRNQKGPFGSRDYAAEELVAEITSWLVGNSLEIGHDPNRHVSYVEHWIEDLKEDPLTLTRAAKAAELAHGYILGVEQQLLLETSQDIKPELNVSKGLIEMDGNTLDIDEVTIPATTLNQDQTADPVGPKNLGKTRTALYVPYSEREIAKAAGARWDRREKAWYAPKGIDIGPLSAWLKKAGQVISPPALKEDVASEIIAAAKDYGLNTDHPSFQVIDDGQIRRVPVVNKSRGQDGAYVIYPGYNGARFYNYYDNGDEPLVWWNKAPSQKLSPTERKQALEQQEALRAETKAKRDAKAAQTAAVIADGLETLTLATNHPYLSSKQVSAFGVYQFSGDPIEMGIDPTTGEVKTWPVLSRDSLIIPIRNIDGQLMSAQEIAPNGYKSYAAGGNKAGGFHLLGQFGSAGPIGIAEGYATGATLHEKIGLPIACAFDSGNLPAVAMAIKAAYPNRTIVIFGDNDIKAELERPLQSQSDTEQARETKKEQKNIGRMKAEQAATAINGLVALPSFPSDVRGSDWNDLAALLPDEFNQQISWHLSMIEQLDMSRALKAESQDAVLVDHIRGSTGLDIEADRQAVGIEDASLQASL